VITIGPNDDSRSIPAQVGDEIQIQLPERPTAGYRWVVVADGTPVCRTIGETRAPGAAIGGEGLHCWRLRADRVGTASVRLVHRRSFESSPEDTEFSVRVVVSQRTPLLS